MCSANIEAELVRDQFKKQNKKSHYKLSKNGFTDEVYFPVFLLQKQKCEWWVVCHIHWNGSVCS